jgi:hypothetical protein
MAYTKADALLTQLPPPPRPNDVQRDVDQGEALLFRAQPRRQDLKAF